MKPIVHIPHRVLSSPAKTVTIFDKKIAKLIADMKETLTNARNPKGVGLAAPQVGEPWRIFLVKPKESDPIRVFINPEILSKSKIQTESVPERDNKLEGCLSIPKIWGKVHRSKTVLLRFQDEQGKIYEESFSGFIATIIQHETDHLNGILFTQRVLEQKEKLYQSAHDEKGREVLDEISLR